jgi:hypothetical protein
MTRKGSQVQVLHGPPSSPWSTTTYAQRTHGISGTEAVPLQQLADHGAGDWGDPDVASTESEDGQKALVDSPQLLR